MMLQQQMMMVHVIDGVKHLGCNCDNDLDNDGWL